MGAYGCFTKKKHSIVLTFKQAGVSLKESFVKRKRSLSFGISEYLFASQSQRTKLKTL